MQVGERGDAHGAVQWVQRCCRGLHKRVPVVHVRMHRRGTGSAHRCAQGCAKWCTESVRGRGHRMGTQGAAWEESESTGRCTKEVHVGMHEGVQADAKVWVEGVHRGMHKMVLRECAKSEQEACKGCTQIMQGCAQQQCCSSPRTAM